MSAGKKLILEIGAALAAFYIIELICKPHVKSINQSSGVDAALKKKVKMKNEQYLTELNAAVQKQFRDFINDIENLGFVVVITSGYRSFKKQAELKKLDSRNATAGFSPHNYGTALDFVLVKDEKPIDKNSSISQWKLTGVPELGKNKYGMRWGGDFAGYSDTVHFDYSNKYDTKKLYAAAIKRWGSAEAAIGNELLLT